MSRATVRAAIAAWFDPDQVEGLTSIWRADPNEIPGPAVVAPNATSGASAVVYIGPREVEKRIALGGEHSGKKQITYECGLDIKFRSLNPDALVAMDDFDAFVENLKQRLRADRKLGTKAGDPGEVWSAGEGPDHVADPAITLETGMPAKNGNATEIAAYLSFPVVEQITS